MKYKDYKVAGGSKQNFESKLTELSKEGYQPQGNVVVKNSDFGFIFVQLMYKEIEDGVESQSISDGAQDA